MDGVEKNIKNNSDIVKYSKLIDLRQVTDTLQVKVYVTGNQYGKKFNKTGRSCPRFLDFNSTFDMFE